VISPLTEGVVHSRGRHLSYIRTPTDNATW
jgi:hypothetical protein